MLGLKKKLLKFFNFKNPNFFYFLVLAILVLQIFLTSIFLSQKKVVTENNSLIRATMTKQIKLENKINNLQSNIGILNSRLLRFYSNNNEDNN